MIDIFAVMIIYHHLSKLASNSLRETIAFEFAWLNQTCSEPRLPERAEGVLLRAR